MKHIHSPRFTRKTPTQTLSCLIAICMFLASIFQPRLKAAGPAPLLTVPDVIAIIVELAAGTALDMWLDQNGDPRNDRSKAMAVGAYYTGANYQMMEKHTSGSACSGSDFAPYTTKSYAVHGNERHTDPKGGPIDQLKKRARLSGWLKTFEVIDDEGNCAYPYRWTVCGSSTNPYSSNETLANLQTLYDDTSLRLGIVLVDKTEKWNVSRFVIYSDYSYSTPALHPKLKEEGYYQTEFIWKKQRVDYSGGKLTGIGKELKHTQKFLLRADRPDSIYLNLVNQNERLLSAPVAYGGVERWVDQQKNVYECAYPNQPILHWFPTSNCRWVDKLVVKERRALFPSELN